MHIDELLQSLAPTAPGEFRYSVGDDWLQGRTLFGGLQAMLAVKAMRLTAPEAPPLWSLQTTFVAPVPPGEGRIRVQILRQGRSALQMEARLMDGEQTAAVVVAVFGAARTSAVTVAPEAVLPPPVEDGPELPYVPGVFPNFTQHYAYRWLDGGLPFSGHAGRANRIQLRQRDAGLMTDLHIIALADAIPPVALSLTDQPTAASTLSWSLEFVHHPPPVASEGWWRMDARIVAARDGYSNQDACLYGPEGELVVLARQVVAVFG